MKTILFHCPFTVGKELAYSANLARPEKIRSAFRDLGCDVFTITGDAAARVEAIRCLKREMRKGLEVGLAYSESSNLPLLFDEGSRFSRHPISSTT